MKGHATGGQMMPPWLWLWLVGDLAVLIPTEVSNERHQIALYTGHGEIAPQVTAGTQPAELLSRFAGAACIRPGRAAWWCSSPPRATRWRSRPAPGRRSSATGHGPGSGYP